MNDRTLPEILDATHVLKTELQSLFLPNLHAIEGAIQHHSARAVVGDPATVAHHKVELANALASKAQAELLHERAQQINGELVKLRQELAFAEAEQHSARVTLANRNMEQAHDEFALAARMVVQAYRKCLRIRVENMQVKGATQDIPPGFTFNHMTNPNNNFFTSQEMVWGPIKVEQNHG